MVPNLYQNMISGHDTFLSGDGGILAHCISNITHNIISTDASNTAGNIASNIALNIELSFKTQLGYERTKEQVGSLSCCCS